MQPLLSMLKRHSLPIPSFVYIFAGYGIVAASVAPAA